MRAAEAIDVAMPVDEGAVDLQGVDGELAQVGERAVAGSEVVDRDAHAELLERRQVARLWRRRRA